MLALIALLANAADLPERDRPGEVHPDRSWDFRHLHLDVTLDLDAREVRGTATHTVAPLGPPSAWLRLHQVGLDIARVTVDGAPVEGWRIGEETLDVPVPPRSGERTVSVTWSATPETGLHFRAPEDGDTSVHAWTQGEGEDHRYWFPGWDHPSDRFTFSADLTVPDGTTAFANGVLVDTAPAEPGWTTFSYRLDHELVTYLVAVAAGELDVFTDDGPVPLEYVVPRGVSEDVARRSLAFAGPQLEAFGEQVGLPYPYPVYRQIAVDRFLYAGMENTTTTILGSRLLLHDPAWRPEHTEMVVAHEVAHQWFGDLLTTYGWRELWLNEGFASFYAHRWMAERHGPGYAAVDLQHKRRWALHQPGRPMAARGWSKAGGDHASVYDRGTIVLHMLEQLLGRETFDAAVRAYTADNRDRLVETADVRRAFEDASGRHLGWFFDQYVHGTDFPEATSSWSWADGQLTVRLAQEADRPFSFFVDVEIGTDRDVITRRAWLDGGDATLLVELPAPPRWVAVDPRGATLAKWTHTQDTSGWVAQLRGSPSPYARLAAMTRLGEGKATEDAVAALREALFDREMHGRFRAKAADPLGKLAAPAALDALWDGITDDDGRVREASVDALAHVPPDDALRDRLSGLTDHEDPVVRASALQVLSDHDGDRALALARTALRRPDPSQHQAVHRVAADVVGAHGGPRDLRHLLPLLGADTPHFVRLAAGHAAADLVDRHDDEALRARLSDALLPWLRDADLRVRARALMLLRRVGDDRAEATLRAWAAATDLPLAEQARDAAEAIRTRDAEAPTSPTGDDATRLEERIEDLEERLERLETWR